MNVLRRQKLSGAQKILRLYRGFNMQLVEKIQQHVEQLPIELQTEVFEYILRLEHKHEQTGQVTEAAALVIHSQLMDQYAAAFEKLAQ